MNFGLPIVLAGLLSTGAAVGQSQDPAGWQQLPPKGTDLAPVRVMPAQSRVESESSKRPGPPANSVRAKARGSRFAGVRVAGRLKAVDKVAMTITVESNGKSVTCWVTSNTRLFKDKKPAIFADGVIGESVSGVAKKTKDGKLELVTLNFGGKAPAK